VRVDLYIRILNDVHFLAHWQAYRCVYALDANLAAIGSCRCSIQLFARALIVPYTLMRSRRLVALLSAHTPSLLALNTYKYIRGPVLVVVCQVGDVNRLYILVNGEKVVSYVHNCTAD
jgi:hypothetical protein